MKRIGHLFLGLLVCTSTSCLQKNNKSKSTPDAVPAVPKAGFCEQNPLTGTSKIDSQHLALAISDKTILAIPGMTEDQARTKVAIWRAICGPAMKKTKIGEHHWNFHTGVCRYNAKTNEILSEGQISNSIPLQPDKQFYYGYRYKKSATGWDLSNSYLYNSEALDFKDIWTSSQDPLLYGLFIRGCDKLTPGGVCPLPRTPEDVATRLAFIQTKATEGAKIGKSLVDMLGVKIPALPVPKGSSAEFAPTLAQQISLSCLEEASSRSASIGLNATTEVASIHDSLKEVVVSGIEMKRVAMFGHHWNIKPPYYIKKDGGDLICGQISHNIKYNQDDQIYYRMTLVDGKVSGKPELVINKGNVVTTVSTFAAKVWELYSTYQDLVGKQKIYVPIAQSDIDAMTTINAKTNELAFGKDWEKAVGEISQLIALLAPEGRVTEALACPGFN